MAKGGFTRERAIQRLDKTPSRKWPMNTGKTAAASAASSGNARSMKAIRISPSAASQYPNKHPVGLFHNLACRDGGLYGEPILTDDGEKLIASKTYRALSGRWSAEFVGQEDGVNIYRPVKFLSAGLTNQPNLPVQLLNEAPALNPQPSTMNHNPP